MKTALLDKEYGDELSGIEQWFQLLSDAERTAAFFYLSRRLTKDQLRAFIRVQDHPLSEIPSSSAIVGTENTLSKEDEKSPRSEEDPPKKPLKSYTLPKLTLSDQAKWRPVSRDADFELRVKKSFSDFARAQKEALPKEDPTRKVRDIEELKQFSRGFLLPPSTMDDHAVSNPTVAKATHSRPKRVSMSLGI